MSKLWGPGHNAEIKKIGDFVLVLETKAALKTAFERLLRINTDLDKLIELKILKKERPEYFLNQAHLLLLDAADLADKAEDLIATDTPPEVDARDLIFSAVIKIKLAYKNFLEISNLLKEALK